MKIIAMRTRIYLIFIILTLGILLFMVMRQFMVDFYWRMAHQDGKRPNEIIGCLEKSIDGDRENALFHFSLGRAFLHKGLAGATQVGVRNKWIRKSIDEFHRAIELEPSRSDYHFHLGMSYGSLPFPPPFYWEVIQDSFKRTLLLNPTHVRHLYSIGIYYLNEYDRLKTITRVTVGMASSNYKRYAAMSKENYQFYFKKSIEVNEAYLAKILEKCFSVTPKYADLKAVILETPNGHAYLARFLHGKGMWEEAKNEYMMAINLEPINPIHYAEFANAFSSRGDFENAITWWQKQKMLNPQDERIYLSLSYGFMRLNRFDDALQELRDLMKLSPEDINYQVKLMRTLLDVGRVDEAIHEYHKAIENNQNFSKSIYDKIRHYQKGGDYPEAIRTLNEALTSVLDGR